MDREGSAFDAGLGRQPGGLGKACNELGTAVGVSRVIERVDTDEDVPRVDCLGPCQRQREKDEIARRDVGHRDSIGDTALRDFDRIGQSRSSESSQVERQDHMALDPQLGRDLLRRFEFPAVALVVIDRQRVERVALLTREAGGDHRVEAARQQHHSAALDPCHLRLVGHVVALNRACAGSKPHQSSIRNSREQNAQSTRIMPFSSRMSLRSSFENRASTSSKCTTVQRQPRVTASPLRTRTSRSS